MSRINDPAQAGRVAKSSFYAGMRVLPRAEREAMYAIYAFCRDVDDIADDLEGSPAERRQALGGWSADVASLYAGGPPGRAAYLEPAVRRFGLAQTDVQAVIAGMLMDVEADIRAPDRATLDLYCDRVASAVGRLSVRVFGMDEAPGRALAHDLGRALQLTNILRDIDEDAAIGRLYLPREALSAAGIKGDDPRMVALDPALDRAGRQVAALAEKHFAAAAALLRTRPRGLLIAPRLMLEGYRGLLARMLRQGWAPPRRRVRTNKLRLAGQLVWLKLTG